MPIDKTLIYVGRCKICGEPNAAAIKEYADGDDVKDMIDSGLNVTVEAHKGLTIKACDCK